MKRKKISLLFILSCLVLPSTLIFSQNISFGGKAGLNMANMYGEQYDIPESGTDMKSGFCVGGFLNYPLNESFSIQPELLYSMKGMQWETSSTMDGITTKFEYEWSLNYLEIPLLAKGSIKTKNKVKPNLFFGPSLAIKLSAKYKDKYEERSGGSYVKGGSEGDLEDIKSTDFGLVFGGGLDIDISQSKLILDIRYTMGLTRIRDYEDTSEKNGVISLLIGFSF